MLINEICPANISVIQNSRGHYDDYIELFNAGTLSLNLQGIGIGDSPELSSSYIFPDYMISPGEKILVYATGDDKNGRVNHYEMPVDGHGTWKYVVGSASLTADWRELNFDDSQWNSGNGGIGYGDGDDGTTVPSCQSVMMRCTFSVSDPADILEAILMMDFDDGFTAYLNGVQIASKNMWPGKVQWNVFATDAHEALMYQGLPPDSFLIDPIQLQTLLQPGENVLAVQTHNVEPNSSDLTSTPYLIFGLGTQHNSYQPAPSWFQPPSNSIFYAGFKLSRSGETVYLINAAGGIMGQEQYPYIESNHCFARSSDGALNWCVSDAPTPLAANDPSRCFAGYTSIPIFSLSGGFYSGSQTLQISTSQTGAVIRYSTNGDDPDSSSNVFNSLIHVDSSTSVRAKVYAQGYLPGRTITQTYLINEESHLPVFSISTDSLNLWDQNTGIYVPGPNADSLWPYLGANFWQDWRKPAAVEYYDKSKQRIFNINAEIEMYGNYSRSEAQKSFEIHMSDKFGTGEINYPLISDKSFITEYENIILRNSGTDWNIVQFRDAMMERIMKSTHSGYLAAEPIRLFLNGQDWGVYNIHEKHNHKWVETNYDLEDSDFDFLSEQGSKINTENGSDQGFWELYDYATSNSPESQEYYDAMNSKLDFKNYMDYFIAETYYDNGDWLGEWTNNIKLWKPKANGSRWKYILLDLDFGLGLFGNVNEDRLEMARNPIAFSHTSEIFDALLENPLFKRDFINRYADLINTIYLPENIEAVMKQFRDSMAFDMVFHFNKWGGDTLEWHDNIDAMMNFVNQRPAIMRTMIQNQFALSGQVELTLKTFPEGAGRIEISTVTPGSYPWTGVYFNGNPVTITAIPNPGYTFDHWVSSSLTTHGRDQQININFSNNDLIAAYFTGSQRDPQISISEFNYHPNSTFDSKDWIELHNFATWELDISGWKISDEADNHVFVMPTGTVIPANGYLVLAEDTLAFDKIYPGVSNRIGPLGFSLKNTGEQIRLFDYTGAVHLSFYYQTDLPWPVEANGFGYTCELLNNSSEPNNGNNWHTGCFGGSPGKASSSLLSILIPITGNNFLCVGTSDSLTIPIIPGSMYQWKVNNNDISGATSNTYTGNQSGEYSVHVSIQGCTGTSEEVKVLELPFSPLPVSKVGTRCGEGPVLLMASSPDSVFWYDAPGGNLLQLGEKFITPSLNQSSSYYAKSGSICPSELIEVRAIIEAGCETGITLFPNPSKSETPLALKIKNLESGSGKIDLTDLCGKVIKSSGIELFEYQSSYDFPLEELAQGVYIIRLTQGENTYFTKFVRE